MKEIIYFLLYFLLLSPLAAEPIKLGMMAPLTGDYASNGEEIKKGIELARDVLRSQGKETQIFYEDACLATQAITATRKFIDIHKINALVGSYCILGMTPTMKMYEDHKIISFHTSVVTDDIVNGKDYIFTTNVNIKDEAYQMAENISKTGVKTLAVLCHVSQWGENYNRFVTEKFEQLGGKIVAVESVPFGVNDMKSEITRIKSKNPAALLIVHVGTTLGYALKQISELRLHASRFSVSEADDGTVVKIADKSAEGLTIFVPLPKNESPEMKAFNEFYQKKYKAAPLPLSRHSYDATILTVNALNECWLDSKCAKDRIYKIKDYSGASGVFTILNNGSTKREFVKRVVKGGKFITE